jgi:hypothetical protein
MPFTHPGESMSIGGLRAEDPPRRRTRLSCTIWGHHVDNHAFGERGHADRQCRCGEWYLRTDGSLTRVRHTLSCFLEHHTYVRMAHRDAHNEYICVQCGHPLLFAAPADPYASTGQFKKKVRYLCGLFGHRVHRVTSRHGFVEHACDCGHSFLKDERPRRVIRHPLVCVMAGHFVRFVSARAGYDEYVCRNCGHPFCFAQPRER